MAVRLGDKTVLGGLQAIQLALAASGAPSDDLKRTALDAVRGALEAFRGKLNRIGHARMFAEKTISLDDPGMVALQRMVESP